MFVPAYEFWSARERFDFKYKKFVIVSIVLSVLTVACSAISIIIFSSYKVEAKIYTEILIKCVVFVFLFVMLICNGRCFFNKKYWKYAIFI